MNNDFQVYYEKIHQIQDNYTKCYYIYKPNSKRTFIKIYGSKAGHFRIRWSYFVGCRWVLINRVWKEGRSWNRDWALFQKKDDHPKITEATQGRAYECTEVERKVILTRLAATRIIGRYGII